MPKNGRSSDKMPTRGPRNLAELIQEGLVTLTEIQLADAHTLFTVETELAEQLENLRHYPDQRKAREHLLGYQSDPEYGDLHDHVEHRLVSEYLIAIGVDAVAMPLKRRGLAYSHIARDTSLVAIPGEIAPEAIVHRLTSCPRVLLYRQESSGLGLIGLLFQRTIDPSDPNWPEYDRWLSEGEQIAQAADLRALLQQSNPRLPSPKPVYQHSRPLRTRRHLPHIPLDRSEDFK